MSISSFTTWLIPACAGALLLASCDREWNADRPNATVSAYAAKPKAKSKAPSTAKEKTPYGQDPGDYILTFSEEFDQYNSRLWNDHTWYEKSNPTRNYAVEDGVLKIWPQRDASGKFFNRTIDTDGNYYQTYGYFEMEAKLPKGKGVWPAFWLFNHIGDRRPEIDIMEAYPSGDGWGYIDASGMARPNVYAATIWLDEGKQHGQKTFVAHTDLSAAFHKYAVKWEPDKQTFYFDGKEIWSRHVSMSDPMYLLLDLWFGGASGPPDHSTPQGKANSYEVNYVRAWKFRKGEDRHDGH